MSTTTLKSKPKEKIVIKKPPRFKVIFHNDDYTPATFVVKVLEIIFNKSTEEAQALTSKVDNEGRAVVGSYPKEVAESKLAQTMMNAESNGYPFLCDLEPEEDEE